MLVDAYIRVSYVGGRGGDSFISPKVQREQIEAWAKGNGATVGKVFEELDESGARADRPLLLHAMDRVEAGESEGIVVAKLDRFGRSLIDGLANIERISSAGGTFVSVQDGLDIGTPTGKLILRIMLSMAEWELDRVRQNWDSARAMAIARGIHLAGFAPFGYLHGRDHRLKVDHVAAPLVVELFRRRGDGETFMELSRWLSSKRVPTSAGNPYFSRTAVTRILRSRVYLGELRSGAYLKVDAHPAIIDLPIWEQAQHPRKSRGAEHHSLLGGILRCATCRMGMYVGSPQSNAMVQTYRCVGHCAGGACSDRATARSDELEPLVEEFVLAGRSPHSRSIGRRTRDCEEAVAQAERDLGRYRDNTRLHETLGDRRFEAGLRKRMRVVEDAALRLAGVRHERESDPLFDATGLEGSWPGLSIAERREAISRRIEVIFIDPGDGPVAQRAHVCTSGTSPIDVPRRSRHSGPLRPFVASDARVVGLGAVRPWGMRRIERELTSFLAGRDIWPRYNEFAARGLGRLFQQMMDSGGPYYWNHRLGIRIKTRPVSWTDQRLEMALAPIMKGRTRWPTSAEFEAFGMTRVRERASERGGVRRWADHFGVELRTRPVGTGRKSH
jgi:DNA invertase Pin-like site-specific DNA recombinase